MAISRINIAAVIQLNKSNIIKEARLVPGSVFPAWKRMRRIENDLKGKPALEELFTEAGLDVAREMIEISGRRWSTAYKEPVVAALVKRTLMQAAGIEKAAE